MVSRNEYLAGSRGAVLCWLVGTLLFGGCGSEKGIVSSEPTNSRPVANAGPDRSITWGDPVTLDGSGSHDPDGDQLTFRWELLTLPAGSGATLSDPTQMTPEFVADVDGDFVVELIVNDGSLDSEPDTVTIHAEATSSLSTVPVTVGAGLQVATSATLGTAAHGGVTVRIESGDPTRLLIAPDEQTAGSASIDVTVIDGTNSIPYVVQGVTGITGTVGVTVSAVGFTDGTATVTVVQPAVIIDGLAPTQWAGFDDVFTIFLGIPDAAGTGLDAFQGPSAAHSPSLVMAVTSSNGVAGEVNAAGTTGATITMDLTTGEFLYRVTFDPLAAGATVVSASVPGFITLGSGSVDVSVALATIAPFSRTVGAGLQFPGQATLDMSSHGGVTVRVESADPTVALIAPDEQTAGSAFIEVFVADGEDVIPYVVQGVAGTTGTVLVTASAPDFAQGTGTITVVQPAVAILGLEPTHSVGTNDVFTVLIGIPDLAGTGLSGFQATSAANSPSLALTLESSDGAVGHVSATGAPARTVLVDLPAGTFQRNVAFVPRAFGATTVSASIPGFVTTTSASVLVTVGTPGIAPFSRTIGAGLQYGSQASLDIPDHGGIVVRITSGDPAVALIAPDATTPGSPFIDVVVADGNDAVPYVVQGVAGTTGTVLVTATAPGFADGTGTITVVEPAVTIFGLGATQSVGTVDGFTVFIGTPNANNTGLSGLQGASAANAPPLVLTVTSSDGAVGQLAAAGNPAATITLTLTAGVFQPGVAFHGVAAGSTTVTVSIPGFRPTTAATVIVTVNP